MTLVEIRKKIDKLDTQVIDLLHQRMKYAIQAGRLKDAVCDPAREEAILRNVLSRKSTLLDAHFIKELYGLIIKKSKQLQESRLNIREGGKENSKSKKSRNYMEVLQ